MFPLKGLVGRTIWVAVTIENEQGLRGTHYVECEKSLVRPELWAATHQSDMGFRVIAACIHE